MNVNPGGSQPKMHDTYWGGKMQIMVYSDNGPKEIKAVLILTNQG